MIKPAPKEKDVIHRLLKWFDHNRYSVLGVALSGAMLVTVGCGLLDGKATDPVTGEPATAITIAENAERYVAEKDRQIDALIAERNAVAEAANVAIERANEKTEQNYAFLDTALNHPVVQSYIAPLGLAGFLVGGGSLLDNRRKDQVIKTIKTRDAA